MARAVIGARVGITDLIDVWEHKDIYEEMQLALGYRSLLTNVVFLMQNDKLILLWTTIIYSREGTGGLVLCYPFI